MNKSEELREKIADIELNCHKYAKNGCYPLCEDCISGSIMSLLEQEGLGWMTRTYHSHGDEVELESKEFVPVKAKE